MTKGELIKALEPYTDDQYIYVNMHSDTFPYGSHVFIQGVNPTPPWHPESGLPDLIGIIVHAGNKILEGKQWAYQAQK